MNCIQREGGGRGRTEGERGGTEGREGRLRQSEGKAKERTYSKSFLQLQFWLKQND